MRSESEIMDFFNSRLGMQRPDANVPLCTKVGRNGSELAAEFKYLSGVEYCCFEWRCHLGDKIDRILQNPEFDVSVIGMTFKVGKGVRSSDKLLDRLRRNAPGQIYQVRVLKDGRTI